jgi:hypothetical protein
MHRKVVRNRELIKFKQGHDDLTWEAIGNRFGISAQRANKIYNDYKEAIVAKSLCEPNRILGFLRGLFRR